MRKAISLCLAVLTAACRDLSQIGRGLYSAVVQGSNAPPSAERDGIRARGATFVRELPNTRLVIVPVVVVGRGERYDTRGAVRLAEELRNRGISKVRVDSTPLRIPIIRHPNQLFIFWTRFKAFAAHEAEHPRTDTDHVLLIDVMGAPEHGMVGAVHVIDRKSVV